MMNKFVFYIILVGTGVLISNHVVCEVDPSDTASIMLEQLKVQNRQLELNRKIIDNQNTQLDHQREQLVILRNLDKKPTTPSVMTNVIVSIVCSILGFIILLALQFFVEWLKSRYSTRSPEMPQTTELMDLAPTYLEAGTSARYTAGIHSARYNFKSPTGYLSCESDE